MSPLGFSDLTSLSSFEQHAASHKFSLVDAEEPHLPLTFAFTSHELFDDWIRQLSLATKPLVIPMSPAPTGGGAPPSTPTRTPPPTSSNLPSQSPRPARSSTIASFNHRNLLSATSPLPHSRTPPPDRSKWKDTSSCEICTVPFALMNRRHHCRSCTRCICADCSISLYVPGVLATVRICNRCEHDWTNEIQSSSRDAATTNATYRKTHPALQHLQVHPAKPLPPLKAYLTSSPRPACGRITVNVLSALSLPSADANGKADPYCNICVTGYSRNPGKSKLVQEWREEERFEMETQYVSATLCPVWRGAIFTLPVIRTCGGTLRITVRDWDAIGKHVVLGMCEIPLEDLPNVYDERSGKAGFEVDNWYELQQPERGATPWRVEPAVPIVDAEDEITAIVGKKSSSLVGAQTAQELFGFIKNVVTEPLVVASKLAKLNLKHGLRVEKKKARIRVKIRLEVNPWADILSHTWLPPVPPIPQEQFDPNVMIGYSKHLHKLADPHIATLMSFLNAVMWTNPAQTARTFVIYTLAYMVHVALGMKIMLILMHMYFFVWVLRIHRGKKGPLLRRGDSFGKDEGEGGEFDRGGMNGMINWIGKRIGNKGLTVLQNTLRNMIDLGEDVRAMFSSGSDPKLTRGVMAGVICSLLVVSILELWLTVLLYSLSLLFILSPAFPQLMRICLGTARGIECFFGRKKLFLIYNQDDDEKKAQEILWPSKQE